MWVIQPKARMIQAKSIVCKVFCFGNCETNLRWTISNTSGSKHGHGKTKMSKDNQGISKNLMEGWDMCFSPDMDQGKSKKSTESYRTS